MKKISLTQGKFAIVDNNDFEWLSEWNWYFHKGYAYRSKWIGGTRKKPKVTTFTMSREILQPGKNEQVDHINGNPLDNRRKNLRICLPANNAINRKLNSNNKSGHKGVNWSDKNKKWEAQIQFHKKKMWLGYFITKEEAALAYNQAAIKYFGEFARLNKV